MSTQELSLDELTGFLTEIEDQPPWRTKADREADYIDGNQIDSEILQRMKALGIPPAIEPLMGPVIASVLGMEVKNRADWKVTPETVDDSDDVADAINFKLHQAEGRSHADTACSDAFKSQIGVGIGCVFVGREEDPFKFPYKVEAIPRNEVFWDWHAKPDLSNARFVIRRQWFDKRIPQQIFEGKEELIKHAASGWTDLGIDQFSSNLGGSLPDLFASQDQERESSIEESHWRDRERNRVALTECWYRRWESVHVLRMPDSRVVELDKKNPAHIAAIAQGIVKPEKAIVSRVRMSWWMGPHKLADMPSPYTHGQFPYVLFWGYREDRTLAPFGLARGMIYLQDQINALHSKSQWMMSARRVTRTVGAVVGDDEQFRQEVARPDADIVLDADAMAAGGIFEVKTDLQLTEQQFRRLEDTRAALRRTGGIYNEFEGQAGSATSGIQFNSQVEQSNQSLADMMDNFKAARTAVGELLVAMIIEDMAGKEETVFIDGKGISQDRTIRLNCRVCDESGFEYLDNDVQRVRLKVGLNDVPQSTTYKQQQLASMSEAFKSVPQNLQQIMLPFLLALMDVPHQSEMIKALKEQGQAPTPEQIQQQIDAAVKDALAKSRYDIDMAKIQQQQPLIEAQIKKIVAEVVGKNVESFFSSTNASNLFAQNPPIAPVADDMLGSAGFVDANQAPAIPALPALVPSVEVPQNTSPLFPPNPEVGISAGIETGIPA